MSNNKTTHLEFIEKVIDRMGSNSFLIKGLCVTLVSALTAFSSGLIIYIPIIFFWFLDSYYLRQEKIFRDIYDEVRNKNEKEIDFLMKPKKNNLKNFEYIDVLFSTTILLFYGGLILTFIIFMSLQKYGKACFLQLSL